jgi:uncharacterized protein
MHFWDSSALIQIYVDQVNSEFARELYVKTDAPLVWWGTQVECVGTFCRLAKDGDISAKDLDLILGVFANTWPTLIEIEPSDAVRRRANDMARKHLLRAADAMQLGAALVAMRGAGTQLEVVCFDKALCKAAAAEGLTVIG